MSMVKMTIALALFVAIATGCGSTTAPTSSEKVVATTSDETLATDWMLMDTTKKQEIVQTEMNKIQYKGPITAKELSSEIESDFELVPPTSFSVQMYIDSKIKKDQEKLDKMANAPLKVVDAYIKNNEIGTPEVYVVVKNTTSKTVDAYKVQVKCYNSFGEPVNDFSGSNIFRGIAQNRTVLPGEEAGRSYSWMLAVQETTTKVSDANITEVHFTDGSSWTAE